MDPTKMKKYKAGKLLIRENDTSRKMFILKEGKVRVFKNYLGKKVTLAQLGPGEVFGELSFFDAEPRSASVEAITDVTAIEVDGDKAGEQIKNLPTWVTSIFKSVFKRFRNMDQQLMVFQSMNEFQKKAKMTDTVSKNIFLELLRFNKTMQMVHKQIMEQDGAVTFADLHKNMDDILGKKNLSLRAYFNSITKHGIIDEQKIDEGVLEVNFNQIEDMNLYLNQEIESNRYLILGHNEIQVLGQIIGHDTKTSTTQTKSTTDEEEAFIELTKIVIDDQTNAEEAISSLRLRKILRKEDDNIYFKPSVIVNHYIHQKILKDFDNTVMHYD